MKILQVTNFFKPSWESGGPARVAYEISKKLIERGHDVTVYTTDGFKSRLNVEKNKPVNVDGIKTYYFKNLSSYLSSKMVLPTPYYLPLVARKRIKEFDIIHIHEHRTILAAIIHHYAKKYNIPYVLQAHGSVLPNLRRQKLKKIFDLLFGYSLLRDASKVIALTKTELEQYKKMGVEKDKIEIIPNGIDLSEYANLPEKGKFRKKYSIRKDEKIILYLGRLHKVKGISLLTKAFSDLTKEMGNVRLVIVGPDDGFLSTLKKQVEILKVNDKILFTGPLYGRDKLEAYVNADVYVLPSAYETFPITLLEACACSVPVIVTNRCGVADFVVKVGYVVEYNKEQLKDAIFRVLSDDKLKRRFGEEGRKLVKKEFSWDKVIKRIEDIYNKCVV